MRIRPGQLERHLARGLASVYVVHGDEPLQREESLDAIRSAARAAGFGERIVLHVETGFGWGELQAHAANLSLLDERKLIDLRMPGGAPGKDGGATLARYAADPPPDTVLLLSCGRLDRRSTSTRWFKALEGAGDVIEATRIEARDLPRWIADRCAARGVTVERDAAEALAERSEGNLLACAQEIDKLRLLVCGKTVPRPSTAPDGGRSGPRVAEPPGDRPGGRRPPRRSPTAEGRPVTVDDVMRSVADDARFGAFDLVNPALEGDGARTLRIMRVLREEGLEPFHVLGTLTWAIRGVCGVAAGLERGARLDDVLRAGFGAWWRRKPSLERALARMSRRRWTRLLEVAEGVDRILKGAPARSGAFVRWSRDDAWSGLERLALAMCGVIPLRAAPYH